jgi:hypothetical protein
VVGVGTIAVQSSRVAGPSSNSGNMSPDFVVGIICSPDMRNGHQSVLGRGLPPKIIRTRLKSRLLPKKLKGWLRLGMRLRSGLLHKMVTRELSWRYCRPSPEIGKLATGFLSPIQSL